MLPIGLAGFGANRDYGGSGFLKAEQRVPDFHFLVQLVHENRDLLSGQFHVSMVALTVPLEMSTGPEIHSLQPMEMKTRTATTPVTGFLAACALALATAGLLAAQAGDGTPVLKIDAGKPGPTVGLRYGLMTEEINFSYDGGLYGELVRNRSFQGRRQRPGALVAGAGRRRRGLDVARPRATA